MHFQFPPAAETKVVRCTRGGILDIIVDLRPESQTYLQHVSVELNEENQRALYVPERFAREAQGKPIRVGMLGAGFMGQGLTNQIVNSVPGMRMVAVYNRKPQRALDVFKYSGLADPI
jgi:hypothetical protein